MQWKLWSQKWFPDLAPVDLGGRCCHSLSGSVPIEGAGVTQKTRFQCRHCKLKMFAAVYGVVTDEAVDNVGGDITTRAISRWDSAPMLLMFLVAPIKYDMRNNLNEKGFVFFSHSSWQRHHGNRNLSLSVTLHLHSRVREQWIPSFN